MKWNLVKSPNELKGVFTYSVGILEYFITCC